MPASLLLSSEPNFAPIVKEFVRETVKERVVRDRGQEVDEMPPPPPQPRQPVIVRGVQAPASPIIDHDSDYVLPSTELLNPPPNYATGSTETHDNIALLESCLAEFNIEATVVEIADNGRGPHRTAPCEGPRG